MLLTVAPHFRTPRHYISAAALLSLYVALVTGVTSTTLHAPPSTVIFVSTRP
jgi:hypothetical protein